MGKYFARRDDRRKREDIARERVDILVGKIRADPAGRFTPNYVRLALKLAKKARMGVPKELDRKYCPECYSFFKLGKTYVIRIRRGKPVMVCKCGEERNLFKPSNAKGKE